MPVQVFESPFQWNLYSSDGRTSLGGTIKREVRIDGEELLLTEISIKGSWPDRSDTKLSFMQLSDDFHVLLSQVLLHKHFVQQLIYQLAAYLESSIPGTVDTSSAVNDQRLNLYIGPPRSAGILTPPLLEFRYSGIGFDTGLWSFPVDQSCIRIFFEELSTAVSLRPS